MQVIIYKPDNGGVAIIYPTPEVVELYGVEAVARKDVPFGKPFKLLDSSELPSDRTFREAWEVDESLLTDGVGENTFTFKEAL